MYLDDYNGVLLTYSSNPDCYWNEALNNRKSIREDQKNYFCPSLWPNGANHDTFTTYGAFVAAVALPRRLFGRHRRRLRHQLEPGRP